MIVPYRAGQKVSWTATRLESETAVGAEITIGNEQLRVVAFRKNGVTGRAVLNGMDVTGPVIIK